MAATPPRGNHAKSAAKRPFIPTVQAGQVLLDLAITQYLTIAQVKRLYSLSVLSNVAEKRMQNLTAAGYCYRLTLQRERSVGRATSVFTLAERGWSYAEARGYAAPKRYRGSEERGKADNTLYLKHSVALSDVYVSLKLLAGNDARLSLRTVHHERMLQSLPKVKVGGRERHVVPDMVVLLREQAPAASYGHPLVIELDMGTEYQAKWKTKLDGLLSLVESSAYEELVGLPAVRMVVVAPGDPTRAKTLCTWTERHLAERHREDAGQWFAFAGAAVNTVDPRALWTAATWLEPFRLEPVPVLGLEAGSG